MLKIYSPSPALADYICCFWSIDTLSSKHTELVYPSGKIQLIFHYRKPFTDRNPSGRECKQPQFALCGQKTSYSYVTATEYSGMVAAVLRTEAAFSLLNFPLNEITGTTISITDIYKSWKNSEWEYSDTLDDFSRIMLIEKFLMQYINTHQSYHSCFIKSCIDEIRTNKGTSHPYKSMVHFDLSERSLQRLFKEKVGLSPKKFAEIVKLENSISLLGSGKTMTDICYEAGYYDQPHFIKAFRQFTGFTPSEFQNFILPSKTTGVSQ